MRSKLAAALAVVAVSWVSLPAAHGDPNADDQRYIALLESHGIPVSTPSNARAGGLAVCEALEIGQSVDHIATEVMESNPISRAEATQAVLDAQTVYCPKGIEK
jgi:Protein of unknown function (DUF732)